jgi:hypothetical protein
MNSRETKVVVLLLGLLGAAILLNKYWAHRAPLAFATAAVGIVTFFFFASRDAHTSSDAVGRESRLRNAIAAAVVIEYLVMVGLVAYFVASEENQQLDPITNTLVASFTSIVGVVIAFYFGSSAYLEVQERQSSNQPKASQPRPSPVPPAVP